MRHVDHDPVAARRAAAICRDRATDYERVAGEIGTTVAQVAWSGCERDRVAEATWAVCDDLRREASSLRATADLLEAAARAAEQREADVMAAARVAAAPGSIALVPSWGHGPGDTTPPTTSSSSVPVGVQ